MNGKSHLLSARRKALSARIARQRLDLASESRVLEAPFAAIDKGITFARYMKQHPVIPALAAAAFFIMKPRGAFKWSRRIWFYWRMYRNARNKLAA